MPPVLEEISKKVHREKTFVPTPAPGVENDPLTKMLTREVVENGAIYLNSKEFLLYIYLFDNVNNLQMIKHLTYNY